MGRGATTIVSVRMPVDLKAQIALIQKNTEVMTFNKMVIRLLDEAITARMTDKENGENPILLELKTLIHSESDHIIKFLFEPLQRIDWMIAKMAKYVYVTRYLLQDFERLILEFHGKKDAATYPSKMADALWDKARLFFQKSEKDETNKE